MTLLTHGARAGETIEAPPGDPIVSFFCAGTAYVGNDASHHYYCAGAKGRCLTSDLTSNGGTVRLGNIRFDPSQQPVGRYLLSDESALGLVPVYNCSGRTRRRYWSHALITCFVGGTPDEPVIGRAVSRDVISNEHLSGHYLDNPSVLEAHDIAYSRTMGEYMHRDDDQFDDYPSDSDYDDGSEDDDSGGCNAEYHSGGRPWLVEQGATHTVGVEVEKEDGEAMVNHKWREVKRQTQWSKESDGSLGQGGYELVSPTFGLMEKSLEKAVASSPILTELINGDYDTGSCGGHIHLGKVGLTGEEFFNTIEGYATLFYGMFPGRAKSGYAKAFPKNDVKRRWSGRSAIHILDTHIELRIFGAVRNVENLFWRLELLRIMCLNPSNDTATVLTNALTTGHPLHEHLRAVYSINGLLRLVERALSFNQQFEAEQLTIESELDAASSPTKHVVKSTGEIISHHGRGELVSASVTP